MRTAGKILEARTSGKGLKEGRVTLRYLAVLPLRREEGERAAGVVSQQGQERDGNGKRDSGASAPKLKEVRNIFMIFPG